MDSITPREVEIAKIAKSADRMAALQTHLKEIVRGKAFRGSLRSAQFLTYIVEQAIAGNFESLKERVIGAELFQRSPSYDTGEDAIVRVTASDVRKRLLQHYDKYGATSDVRINLPLGSYIPEILWDAAGEADRLEFKIKPQDSLLAPHVSAADPAPASAPSGLPLSAAAVVDAPAIAGLESSGFSPGSRRRWLSVTVPLAVLNVVLLGFLGNHFLRAKIKPVSVSPWSAFFNSPHPIRLITSDPAIVSFERITENRISLMDYENHSYTSRADSLIPEAKQFLLWGDWAAPGDLQIAVSIAELAQGNSRSISVQPASRTRLLDLKTDDNFIFLGSPRSNPWVSLFNDGLDFQFTPVDASQNEVIRNLHPKQNEQSTYAPTGTTGETYALIAFIQNPDRDGQVLLLGGESGLGTDVAGRLVTDPPRLSLALQKCGIPPSGSLKHFELLLRVSAMAGSSRGTDVMACHILPDASTH